MKKFFSETASNAVLSDDKRKKVKSKNLSKKTSEKLSEAILFRNVNSKFLPLLNNQLGKVSYREVIDECIERTAGIDSMSYKRFLRNTMKSLIHNFEFIKACNDLGFDPLCVAQIVPILNHHGKVKTFGFLYVFEESLCEHESLLKETIFTESELADAEYDNVEGGTANFQRTEISDFIENAIGILSRGKKVVETLPESAE